MMKQSDIITIVLITMIGTIAAGFAVNAIMGNPDDAKESWKTIKVVEASLTQPNPDTFNADAINPTVEVYVGNCIDQDQNGELSEMEQVACGWRSSKRIIVNESGEIVEDNTGQTEQRTSTSSSESTSGTSTVTPITVEEILRQRQAQQEAQQQATTPTTTPTTPTTTPSGSESTPTVIPGTEPVADDESGTSGTSGENGTDIPTVEL